MLDEQEKLQVQQIIDNAFGDFLRIDRYNFRKHLQILDQRNIQLGKDKGTKLGTESTQKLGLWDTTPVIQPSAISDSATQTLTGADTVDITKLTTDLTNLKTATNAILSALRDIGIIAT